VSRGKAFKVKPKCHAKPPSLVRPRVQARTLELFNLKAFRNDMSSLRGRSTLKKLYRFAFAFFMKQLHCGVFFSFFIFFKKKLLCTVSLNCPRIQSISRSDWSIPNYISQSPLQFAIR